MARQAQARRTVSSITSAKTATTATSKSKKAVDYSDSSQFTWTKKLQATLSNVFGIKKLRLCQEGVLNAVLDGRDVICIMPTGGGKSVCFQAPAVLTPGCTLVSRYDRMILSYADSFSGSPERLSMQRSKTSPEECCSATNKAAKSLSSYATSRLKRWQNRRPSLM